MKARVCQLFEVCQHEFANFSLPCEGRLRDFNQTKLNSEINVPFLLNEFGEPRFFRVFAKNSLIKSIFEEGKKAFLIVERDSFFAK